MKLEFRNWWYVGQHYFSVDFLCFDKGPGYFSVTILNFEFTIRWGAWD